MPKSLPAAIAAVLLFSAGAAVAHPHIVSATPAANGSVTGSPSEIRLKFSEAVVLKFTGAEIKDAAGKAVATGKAALAKADKSQLVVPVTAKLTPGVYQVTWHAVAADTHHVDGHYSFTVK